MIRQGEIYLCKAIRSSGDTKKRPALVISEDRRNYYSSTVLIVPFTSRIDQLAATRVLISTGEGGLERDSVAMCDLITTVKQSLLERGPYGGAISRAALSKIQEGIMIAIGVY
ncbi:type II toxin-antitoxin system PemK/MazF family toxin [Romeria aff. gracilis LEGE 07310]|uniref:Type II toxin-antitoxin system PemK/MazF family toxin n=1 Tax=Vasconcelosia minhoensis LEGE 07310 TaxID=915328 RepID=A0A8J7ABG2_9CYAN|nr:type II toxin-antitoxin system PemK/MazF family toxin [Romeria aff. gracilis LEGE 07310]